jgi:hypothetical protein
MNDPNYFDWVSARSKCSLESVFQLLRVAVDDDLQKVSSLNRIGVKFDRSKQSPDTKIIVTRVLELTGFNESSHVIFELKTDRISVTKRIGNSPEAEPLFEAIPGLNEEGECLLRVKETPLKLWQVSRKALEELFFWF